MAINVRSSQVLPKWVGAVVLALAASSGAYASTVVYDFDALVDGAQVTNQFAGLNFTQTTAVQAGISLNEFEFPPKSGDVVVFDDGGAITIEFASPVFSVGAFFTYVTGLSLSVYDSSNNLLTSGLSLFASNAASSGDAGSSPNEFISFADASGRISRFVITGALAGGSFTMDDLTVDAGTAVPEPSTVALVLGLLGLGALPGGWMRRRSN
jgi:hypothetical protein